jgi:rSAM/selenodomain-associated transferase 2/rSAM/selenodomain-associated transferase 1
MGTRREPPRPASRERLVVFTRYPEPRATKTRLIPLLGPKGAAGLQRLMTEHILRQAAKLRSCRRLSVEVRYEGGSRRLMRRWLGPGLHYRLQEGGDLGKRMELAFKDAFAEGAEACIVIGSDCPGITQELLEDAFDQLAQNDLVLGPAADGGYYLIGLRNEVAGPTVSRLFTGITWGTGEVLTQTLKTARGLGLRVAKLELLRDVDRPEDLVVWRNVLSKTTGRISVIIPTLNEVDNVAAAIASAGSGADVEIIVADGGSDDGTQGRASSLGLKMLTSPHGRARQMNKAAALAAGDILLFLHADTLLPRYFDVLVRSVLARPGVAAGAFEFRLDARRWGLRVIERLVNWRSRRLQMPYGDQAIFMKARTFRAAGGFPALPIMEDFELVRRLKRMGRIEVVPAPVVTSARRWLSLGVLRTTLINQLTIAAYLLGISPSRLADWHQGKR